MHGTTRLGHMKQKHGEHPFGDAGQLILLGLFAALWVADSFFLRLSIFLAAHVPLSVRLGVATPVWAVALYLIRAAHVALNHERFRNVVMSGVFRYTRHPLYLGSLLFYLGLVLATTSLLSCLLLVGIFLFYDYIAGYEERLLLEKFGEEYRRYRDQTGKWLPKLGTRQ
jgi:protein-S-isoprenylcysteine O-methyltransferase Ste14